MSVNNEKEKSFKVSKKDMRILNNCDLNTLLKAFLRIFPQMDEDQYEIMRQCKVTANDFLDSVFILNPTIKKDKGKIIYQLNEIINNKNISSTEIIENEIIYERVEDNGVFYYCDKYGCIWNNDVYLVGVIDNKKINNFNKKYNLEKLKKESFL